MQPMRVLKLPRLLVLAFALLLVSGQQAALAHMIGHVVDLGAAAAQVVVQAGDDEHGAAQNLSHVCTTCLVLDTFAAPLPALSRQVFGGDATAVPPAPTFGAYLASTPRHYSARAPPPVL